jgi:chemotaxis protein CheD
MDLAESGGYFLQPGYIFFSKGETSVRTVVGTCVAVCLWDRTLRYGGMNHFLYPSARDKKRATPRYGNVATLALIKIMEEAGCQRHDIVAQVLGGAIAEGKSGRDLGKRNIDAARQVLSKKGIAIISEDTGGYMGRKVLFDTATGQLAVLKVHKLRDTDWISDDE